MVQSGPVNIQLTASGITEVISAFKSIEERVIAMERKISNARRGGMSEEERAARQSQRNREKTAKEAAKAAEKQAKKEITETDKAEKERVRAVTQSQRLIERMKKRSAEEMYRIAKKQADDEIGEARRATNERQRLSKQLAGGIMADVRGTLGRLGSMLSTGLALGGGLSLAGAFSRQMSLDREARTASIRSDVPGQTNVRISKEQIIAQSRALGRELNLGEDDLARATGGFITKSSRGDVALKMMPYIANLSKSEGANLQDLSESLGIVMKQNPNMSSDELQKLGRILVGQGRSGTVELTELAKYLPTITSTSAMYAGNQGENMVKLSSIFQSAFSQTGDVAEAATATTRLATDITKPAVRKKVEALLGHTIDVGGKIMDPQQLIAEVMGKTKGDIFGLQKAGFEERSARALRGALMPALNKGGGTEAGITKAVMDYFNELNSSAISETDQRKHLAEIQQDDSEKLSKAFNDLQRELGEKLTPVIVSELIPALQNTIPHIKDLLDGLVHLVKWIDQHPWQAVFAGIGIKVTQAIVAEIIAANLKNLLAQSLGVTLPGLVGGAGAAGRGAAAGLIPLGPAALVVASGALLNGDMPTTNQNVLDAATEKADTQYAADSSMSLDNQNKKYEEAKAELAKLADAPPGGNIDATNARVTELSRYIEDFEKGKTARVTELYDKEIKARIENLEALRLHTRALIDTTPQGADAGPRGPKGANLH